MTLEGTTALPQPTALAAFDAALLSAPAEGVDLMEMALPEDIDPSALVGW